MKTPTFITAINTAVALTVLRAQSAFAQSDGFKITPQGSADFNTITNATVETTFSESFARIIDLIGLFVGFIAVLMLIYSGFLYITAGGDDAKTKKGRAGIINSIIGIVIIVAAYTIVRFAVTGAVFVNNEANGNV
jgi:hypothetical protein